VVGSRNIQCCAGANRQITADGESGRQGRCGCGASWCGGTEGQVAIDGCQARQGFGASAAEAEIVIYYGSDGLRRAAIGIVQPLIEHNVDFDLAAAVKESAKTQPIEVGAEVQKQILDFITGRLNVVLKDAGYKYDVVDAVLAEQSNNPAGSLRAVKQLQAWVERKDWHEILPAFARCVRIIRSPSVTSDQLLVIGRVFMTEPEEMNLFDAVLSLQPEYKAVDEFLNAIVELVPLINAFFDKVLVMAEDKIVRNNRLALVGQIASLSYGIADLSKLEGF